MAVVQEGCLSIATEAQQQVCLGLNTNSSQPVFVPRLQTTLDVDLDLPPFRRSGKIMSELPNPFQKGDCEADIEPLYPDVSTLKQGAALRLQDPYCQFRILKPLSRNHLLLEEAPYPAKELVSSAEGHRECFDDLDADVGPKVLVHIQSTVPQSNKHAEGPLRRNTMQTMHRYRAPLIPWFDALDSLDHISERVLSYDPF